MVSNDKVSEIYVLAKACKGLGGPGKLPPLGTLMT